MLQVRCVQTESHVLIKANNAFLVYPTGVYINALYHYDNDYDSSSSSSSSSFCLYRDVKYNVHGKQPKISIILFLVYYICCALSTRLSSLSSPSTSTLWE